MAKPGRARKGGVRFPVRVPEEHRAIFEQQAAQQGLSLSEVVANAAARGAGLAEPYPARTSPAADQLPLGLAA